MLRCWARFDGRQDVIMVTSSQQYLTLRFYSDDIISGMGWSVNATGVFLCSVGCCMSNAVFDTAVMRFLPLGSTVVGPWLYVWLVLRPAAPGLHHCSCGLFNCSALPPALCPLYTSKHLEAGENVTLC